jgi:2-oxoisovalerate dehydrogenase E2 component (dihydrolipoyl transacylase)
MSRVKDFKLPDLGEGLTEGEILQWMVKPGDEVKLNQPIVEVETAKAAVEVPSPYAGVVTAIHHAAGTTVDVGAVIISFDTDPGAGELPVAEVVSDHPEVADMVPRPPADASGPQGALIGEVGPSGRTATLVGYGPKSVTAKRRARTDNPAPVPAPVAEVPPPPPATAARVSAAAVGLSAAQSAGAMAVLAKPPVRKLAKELGVDLGAVVGSGPGGTITRTDVEAAVAAGSPAPQAIPVIAPYDPETRERRIAVKGVRKMTAQAMVGSAFSAPHVTEFITLDITPTMELVQRLRELPEFAGVKVTPLLLVAKALLLAVRRNPEINSTFTDSEIVVKEYVNLGIAAATPRGLLVPNIKDADQLSLVQLAQALQELVTTARDGRTTPADMARGTITITNVGVFGVDTGTPILNPGESAILCFGAVRPTPWVVDRDGQQSIEVRQVTQLALSFDHRNVDGQLGSQFLADIARVLSDPATGLAWT